MTSNLEKHRIQKLCELRHEFLEESAADRLVCFLHAPPYEAFFGAPVLGQINFPRIDFFLEDFKLVIDPATPESDARSMADRWMWGISSIWRPCNVIVVAAEDAFTAARTGKVSSESQHKVHALVVKFQKLLKQVDVACNTQAFRELNPFDRKSTASPLDRGCDLLSLMFWSAPPRWMHNSAFSSGGFDVLFWTFCPFVEAAKTIERCLLTEEHPQVFPDGIEWPVWAGHRPATPTKWAITLPEVPQAGEAPGDGKSASGLQSGDNGTPTDAQPVPPRPIYKSADIQTNSSPQSNAPAPTIQERLDALKRGVLAQFFENAPPQQQELFEYLFKQPSMKATKQQIERAFWTNKPLANTSSTAIRRVALQLQEWAPQSGWHCVKKKSVVMLVSDQTGTKQGLK